jgi:hypothetical protein
LATSFFITSIENVVASIKVFYSTVSFLTLFTFFVTYSFCVPESEEHPFEYLFVNIGIDHEERNLFLAIGISKQEINPEEHDYGFGIPEVDYYQVTFTVGFPFKVKDEFVGEISRFVLLVNDSQDIPGFGFSEAKRTVYYRHVLINKGGEIDGFKLITIFGAAMFMAETFSESLEAIGTGTKGMKEVIDEFASAEKWT